MKSTTRNNKPQQPVAIRTLMEAANIMEARALTYDSHSGERSMGKTVAVFNIITGHNISEADGWLFMQSLKDVRQWSTPAYHEDSAIDSVAYAALKTEALDKGV